MTVCIAALADNGGSLVLAADRMVSTQTIEFEHPSSRKLTPLANTCAALTAGDALAHRELLVAVRTALDSLKSPTVEQIVSNTKAAYQHTRQQRIVEKILAPRAIGSFAEFYNLQTSLPDGIAYVIQTQIESYDFNLSILIGGMGHSRGHIYVIDNPGTSACWDSIGFVAIGSGQYLAMHQLIGSECHDGLELAEVLVHVFDAKEAATRAPGVGKMGDIAIITNECTYAIPDKKWSELEAVSRKRQDKQTDWLQASRDFIRSLQKERITLLREQFEQQYPIEDQPNDPSCENKNDGDSA